MLPTSALAPQATYPEGVPTVPNLPPTAAPRRSGWSRLWSNLGRDSRLILPGLFISLAAFIVLIPLFALAVGTAVIWVGVLLLPVVLLAASGFADLSRARARQWGAPIAEVTRRPRGRGHSGWLGIAADSRRWVDLLFEAVFALPVRILTFSVAVTWFVSGLGALTYFVWGRFLPPDGSGLVDLIVAAWNQAPIVSYGFSAEATFQFAAGLVLLVTFPFVLHALALLEIGAVTAGLSPTGAVAGTPAVPAVHGAAGPAAARATESTDSPTSGPAFNPAVLPGAAAGKAQPVT
ncbi:sensor domain-containing protein [Brevibacterium casei]|uniref:Sensor n=3 Tax=Brevibacterium casei TaxID=33889 RepID=A0A2H1HP65_9MICO|nr:sensor domain-containing protein [Brevibacterium casei]QPR38557.1 sensor domain-containing protein [Brevibacterium casei]QPR42723.1 sensor domain-containing protein [Brevibacterium casei]SMX64636.1 Putative sensor [Brevibacterium casei CIP 102111]VEW13390.1 Uncharacterised protein [Brevibacterium casei]